MSTELVGGQVNEEPGPEAPAVICFCGHADVQLGVSGLPAAAHPVTH